MFARDVLHMMRQLRRSPMFAFVTIALVALGIGATTSVFGLVRGVLFRPLPYGDAGRLAVVWADLTHAGNHTYSVTPATYYDIRTRTSAFTDVAYQQTGGGFTLRDEKSAQVVRAGMVSGNFFATIRSGAALGRTITVADERAHVVVLSEALWRTRFGADPAIIGKSVTLDDAPYTVIGVMPRTFDSPWVFKAAHLPAALWVPLAGMQPNDRQSAVLQVIVRLRNGVTFDAAGAQLKSLAASLAQQFPETNRDVGLNLVPMRDQIIGHARTPLLLLLAAILFLLLVACANIASLLLQRAMGRQHELAVRLAIGASRARIASQLMTENAVIGVIGGVLGIVLGRSGLHALVALAPSDTPRLGGITMDRAVMLFALATTLVVAALLAVAPLLRRTIDIAAVLRAGRTRRHDWTRSVLGFLQVALAVALLVGGTLLVRSFARLTSVDPGFDMHNVLTMRVGLPPVKYANPVRKAAAMDAVDKAVRNVPGVVDAGLTSRPPLDPPFGYAKVNVLGAAIASSGDQALAGFRIVTPLYLRALSVPLVQGRALNVDDHADAAAVTVVNNAFVKEYLAGRDPVGARVSFGQGSTQWVQVVGVVGDMNNGGLDAPPIPEAFVPFEQNPIDGATLVVRTSADPHRSIHAIQQAIAAVDPGIATQEALTMEEVASATVATPRFSAFLLTTFAVLAVILALLGVYAIIAQAVTSQARELTIRAALGAPAHRMLMPVLQNGLTVSAAGIVCGFALARAGSRLLASQLFGITTTDTTTYAAVAVMMLTITIAACIAPARRVLRTNPAAALR